MEKKTYDAAFKQEAIRLVEEQGEKTAAVAKKLGVTNKTMYRWVILSKTYKLGIGRTRIQDIMAEDERFRKQSKNSRQRPTLIMIIP